MAKQSSKHAPRKARAGARPPKRTTSARPAETASPPPAAALPAGPEQAAAAQRFVNDLLIRGEADTRDQDGTLPQQATHVIKKQKPDGSVEVERVRFKTF
jgi:hypothetical protein